MNILEAIILGAIQGITEFLPVSSSGHIELGKAILGINIKENLLFSVLLHFATALSTIIIFYRDILSIFIGIFNRKKYFIHYTLKIALSMIPVGIIGILLKNSVEDLFKQQIALVGTMLLATGFLLLFSHLFKPKTKSTLNYFDALLIGSTQAVAILPGISRSGATIATALLLGVEKADAARFSFLMVLPPIIGATLLEFKKFSQQIDANYTGVSPLVLTVGFLAAFATGLLACRWMVRIVKRGKLLYFAAYCFIVGIIGICQSFI